MHKVSLYAIGGLIIGCLTFFCNVSSACPIEGSKWTTVEQKFLVKSGRQASYPNEYFNVIEVRNNYELGKLTALRFIEWAAQNPNGVIAFTSGSTPEFFIKFLDYYKNNWSKTDVQNELHYYGIHLKKFPKTSDLKLVQMEEIYPLNSRNYKKVSNYIKRHYVKVLQIKPQNLLLMDIENRGILAEKGMNVVFMNGKVDLSVMQRKATSQIEIWQQKAIRELKQFCEEYDNKIRKWGGIDFCVGSLSYDGQLGYIQSGTSHDSKTHIVALDYKTAAQASKEMGGIEYVRGKLAITIGIGTLTMKPNVVMLVMAGGESKAQAVRDSVERRNNPLFPATLLQKYASCKLYITDSSGKLLDDRQTEDFLFKSKHGWMKKHMEEVIIYVSLQEKKPILSLTHNDLNRHARGRLLLDNPPKPFSTMLQETHASLIKKIDDGAKLNLARGIKVMHTAPHHEDIILGYYPLLEKFSKKYKNHYVYFTSGFNAVPDSYVLSVFNHASDWWIDKESENLLRKPYEKILNNFKIAYLKQDKERLEMQDTLFALKHLVYIFDVHNLDELKHMVRWFKDEYFATKLPGDLDVGQVKILKSLLRESEADKLALLSDIPLQNISNLRSQFYSGREFMRTPRYDTDVVPFINLYNKIHPDIITVLDDPESMPSIINYRVLQIIAQGLRSKDALVNEKLQIIGYRNIWFKYNLYDEYTANIFVPVSSQMLAAQTRIYSSCFSTQKHSSFPSPVFDGDFSALADTIMRDQLADLKILLGADYFAKNQTPEIRDAAGFIFLNQMGLNDFFRRATHLQPLIDLEEAYIAGKK